MGVDVNFAICGGIIMMLFGFGIGLFAGIMWEKLQQISRNIEQGNKQ